MWGPYGPLWLLAPSQVCGRMRCLGSAWLVLRKGAPPSFHLQEQLANQRSAEIFGWISAVMMSKGFFSMC